MVRFLLYRPIAVLITTLALLVLGVVTFRQIPVSLLPDIAIPEITVQVTYPGAAARELQQNLVKPRRNQLQQVTHLADIETEAQDGLANIRLRFDYGTDVDLAYIETNEKIDGIISRLPRDLERPKVIKAGAGDIPVFNLNVEAPQLSKNGRSFLSISEFCENVLKRRIEQLPEVVLVDIAGLSRPEVVILPNRDKLLGLGMNEQHLAQILEKNNIELGNLLVKDGQYQYSIRFSSVLKTPADIENIYFRVPQTDRVLPFKEIATVQIREQKLRGMYTYNGQRTVVMSIIKQSDTQMLQLKEELNILIDNFHKDYPDLRFSITQDQTELLDLSISNLISNLIIGGLCAFAVIFLFLGDVKAPILIGITIPVSLIVTFLFFYLLGISINIISLAGLVLGIGMVVDSAIIVIENIEQFRAEGHALDEACIAGTNEVMMPLFTSILTNSAVFLPLVFLSGIAGSLFYDQAVSVSLALGVSLLCSLILIPVLYRLFYRRQEVLTGYVAKKDSLPMRWAGIVYETIMRWVFRYKVGVILFFAGVLGLSGILFLGIDKQGMPDISRTELRARIDWNEPLNAEENNRRMNAIMQKLGNDYLYAGAFVGQQQMLLNRELQQNTNESTLYLKMNSIRQFEHMSRELQQLFDKQYSNALLTLGASQNVFEQLFQTGEAPLQARILSNRENTVPAVPITQGVHARFMQQGLYTQPPALQRRMYVNVLREKLLLYEIEYASLYQTLKTLFNENNVGSLKGEQQYVPIVVGGREETIQKLISEATVTNAKGQPIPISSLIHITTQQGYKSLFSGKEGDFVPFNFQVTNEQVPDTQNSIREIAKTLPDITVNFTGAYFWNLEFVKELGLVLLVRCIVVFHSVRSV